MKIDLLHNKIIKDTVTESFKESFYSSVAPLIEEMYPDAELLQMYEDYLADGFMLDGDFCYPLTVVSCGEAERAWIAWNISDKKAFAGGVPYSYIGTEPLEFDILDSVPEEFSEKLVGRASYFDEDAVILNVEAPTEDKTLLVGKYSQTFIDEMVRKITEKIAEIFSVKGFSEGGFELSIPFEPNTYMEHVVENVTYRRLKMTARGCAPKDFWIKWTRTDAKLPYTVSDHIEGNFIVFDLAEDVPQKIKEKEYRYLVRTSADKYQAAMGRKNITEWRDMVKRVIRRGELKLCDTVQNKEPDNVLAFKLQEVLLDTPTAPKEPEIRESTASKNDDLAALLKNVLGVSEEDGEEDEEDNAPDFDEPIVVSGDSFDSFADTEKEEDATSEEAEKSAVSTADEEELRSRIEAEIRARMEAEAEELRRAHEELKAENERLSELARIAEEKRLADEAQKAAENERLRQELESKARAEAREKELMAEAARLALLEREKILEEERRREAEAERERLAREAAERETLILEQRRREEERIRREAEEARAAAMRAPEPAPAPMPKREVSYVSKNARLLFRRPVDPNITKRIHEIILTTVKYFHKEDVYIKIKATVPDPTTVNLYFAKIPAEENELLVNIIKVLGKSDLGITKVFLE